MAHRRRRGGLPLRPDSPHPPEHQRRRRGLGLCGQRRGGGGQRRRALRAGGGWRVPPPRRQNAPLAQSGDAQTIPPPSRPIPARRPDRGARSATKARWPRLQAEGRAGRFHDEPSQSRRARTVGTAGRQTRADRVGPGDHDPRAARRGGLQQRVRAALPGRLFPHVRGAEPPTGRDLGLPQAGDDRRRRRRRCRRTCRREPRARWREAGGLGRPGHAHRLGRGRGLQHGFRRGRRRVGFRLRATRQRRDAAPLPGGDRPLLRVGRGQSDTPHPRCRRRGPGQRAAGTAARSRSWRTLRPRRGAHRRPRHVADGNLVQRGAGTLRARHRRRGHAGVRRHLPARALPACGGGRGDRRTALGGGGPGVRREAGGHAARGPAGRPAKEDARFSRQRPSPPSRSIPADWTWPRRPGGCCVFPRWPARSSS